jgi:hypothetical protein
MWDVSADETSRLGQLRRSVVDLLPLLVGAATNTGLKALVRDLAAELVDHGRHPWPYKHTYLLQKNTHVCTKRRSFSPAA